MTRLKGRDHTESSQTELNTKPENRIADALQMVREKVARAEADAKRPPGSVRLVAVTKTVDAQRVCAALRAGITDLGENYIQEARAKIGEVQSECGEGTNPFAWHFIGHLQRNKAKDAVRDFSLIHTVDNLPLAREIARQAEKQGKATQAVLIEVRLGGGEENAEDERAGIAPHAVLDFAAQIADVPHLSVRGLMAIAPWGTTNETVRPYFARLRTLWEQLPPENRHELSMGMSGDFEAAIREGATIVRLGTALFGRRD